MNFLVTGSTSFLGSAVSRVLLDRGHAVYAPVRPESKNRSVLPADPSFHLVDGSMENTEALRTAGLPGIDVCIHFAWAGVGVRGRMDPEIQEKNVSETLSLMRVVKQLGCRRFLFAGSQAEYGVTLERVQEGVYDGKPVREDTPCRPISLYGKGKLRVLNEGSALAEQLCMEYRHMRIFSVYGPGDHPTSLISSAVRAAQEGRIQEFGPCAQDWNFLYITDCAKAVAALAETDGRSAAVPGKRKEAESSAGDKTELRKDGCVYNIGSRDTRCLKAFAQEIFAEAAETGGSCVFLPRPVGPEGTPWLSPDISKICRLTGWEPETGFREGIRRMLQKDGSGKKDRRPEETGPRKENI